MGQLFLANGEFVFKAKESESDARVENVNTDAEPSFEETHGTDEDGSQATYSAAKLEENDDPASITLQLVAILAQIEALETQIKECQILSSISKVGTLHGSQQVNATSKDIQTEIRFELEEDTETVVQQILAGIDSANNISYTPNPTAIESMNSAQGGLNYTEMDGSANGGNYSAWLPAWVSLSSVTPANPSPSSGHYSNWINAWFLIWAVSAWSERSRHRFLEELAVFFGGKEKSAKERLIIDLGIYLQTAYQAAVKILPLIWIMLKICSWTFRFWCWVFGVLRDHIGIVAGLGLVLWILGAKRTCALIKLLTT